MAMIPLLVARSLPAAFPPFLEPGQIWVDNGGIEFTVEDVTA